MKTSPRTTTVVFVLVSITFITLSFFSKTIFQLGTTRRLFKHRGIKRMASITIDEAFGSHQLLKRYEADPSTIFTLLDTLRDTKDVFIVAKATWCPDCQAVPAVVAGFKEHAIKQQSLMTVVICDVGTRELWKSGTHPLKSTTGDAPSLQLAGVPMVIHWENGVEKARLTKGLTDGKAMEEGEATVITTITTWLSSLTSRL